ncbi:MAG: glycosyltransferase, partial [Planctomycetales bacterium]
MKPNDFTDEAAVLSPDAQLLISQLFAQPLEEETPESLNRRFEMLERLLGRTVCRSLGLYRIPDGFVLSVVIPVFNEADSVRLLLQRVRAVPLRTEVSVVDDHSEDGTHELLLELQQEMEFKLIRHDKNQGKGAALRTGF